MRVFSISTTQAGVELLLNRRRDAVAHYEEVLAMEARTGIRTDKLQQLHAIVGLQDYDEEARRATCAPRPRC